MLNLIKIKKILYKIIIRVFIIISISAIVSNTYVLYQNKIFEDTYKKVKELNNIIGVVISRKQETNYYNKYIIKVCSKPVKNKKFIIYVKKGTKDLEYGDKIAFECKYEEPSEARNFKGFNYKEYLKTKKTYGTFKVEKQIKTINKNAINKYFIILNNIREKIIYNTKEFLEKEYANVFLGIILGIKDDIEDEYLEYFKLSSMAHVLAVSGMHTAYVLLILNYILNRISKRKKYLLTIFALIIFMFLASCTPSVVRAVVMAILFIFSKLFLRKNDFLTSISISLIVLLVYNPYLIKDIGLLLSFCGTLGIVLFSKVITELLEKFLNSKIASVIGVSLSAQILIIPILIFNFNMFSVSFIFSSFIIFILVGPIFIYGSILVLISFISIIFAKKTSIVLGAMLKLLTLSAKKTSQIPIFNFIVKTPNIICVFIYYLLIFAGFYFLKLSKKQTLRRYEKKILNKFNLKKVFKVLIVILLLTVFVIEVYKLIPKDLKIFFIDVGQGDSTLIITSRGKTILIDGGEEQNVLLPYLLDRGITKIDYIIISHFDSDHVGGLFDVIESLKVKNIIISKQVENTENYSNFLKIIKKKKINVIVVGSDNYTKILNIEKGVFLEFLWPDNSNLMTENKLNNNSIVFKLNYKKFSMLFTGDIEEEGEVAILQKYRNNLNTLNSVVLKVAHHGSKTSSRKEFLEAVNAKIALIGVADNNKFGHPNFEVIKKLENMRN